MKCREFDNLMEDFVEEKMDYRKLKEFLEHDRTCKKCHDDLEIHFLMSQILQNEESTSYNLAEALREHTQKALKERKKYYICYGIQCAIYVLSDFAAVAALVAFLGQ